MRQKFPEGSGGPFIVPGVGPVIGGEEFDCPEGLVAGCVPVDEETGATGNTGDAEETGDTAQAHDSPADPPQDKPASKARTSKETGA